MSFAPEESEVVHDLLAYLAQRMIEMNKEKNAQTKVRTCLKGDWHVEELANKIAIKEYYEAGVEVLAG